MGEKTLIAWTDKTFNAWMGCEKVSAGCEKCYAAELVENRMGLKVWGRDANRQTTKEPWNNLPRWAKQAKEMTSVSGVQGIQLVFTGSLMDWAEGRKDLDPLRERMWEAIRKYPTLHFQLLTKRPGNIERYLPKDWGQGYPNVWLGTSIEDMRVASRADVLSKIPAVVRFISYEPAIGHLDDLNLKGIDWVIYGGESGSGYRPEGEPGNPKLWARNMRYKCVQAKIAFFHKQSNGIRTEMGIELDGEIVREFPTPRAVESREERQGVLL